MVVSGEELCFEVKYNELKEISELSSTQEEVDIKIFLHANHYLESSSSNLTIYSPSGYTDIIVLAVTLLNNFKERLSLMAMAKIKNISS